MDCHLLFAYGTLRRGFSRHGFLVRLGAQFAGRGMIQAELYDLGDFPGALPADSPRNQVAGELYRLPNPASDLELLDRVEAFGPVSPESSLLRREIVEVTLENRTRLQAWAYWLNRWHGPRRRIASGDYAKNGE